MIELDTDARVLGLMLGLGDLNGNVACMRYANACVCAECVERAELARMPPNRPRQPWDAALSAA